MGQTSGHPYPYTDRADAGRVLAGALADYRGRKGLLVLGLPRGGVPVAAEVAGALDAALDVVLVRKIGHPRQPELAAGAVAEAAGERTAVWNDDVVRFWLASAPATGQAELDAVLSAESAELRRRAGLYRPNRPVQGIRGNTVIVVDDGLATGATMRAALAAVRNLEPQWLVAAAPMSCAPAGGITALADDVVIPWADSTLSAVGQAYRVFGQTGDAEVRALLRVE
ncbi:phosphoribosyltransferase [Arthrobacter sp. Sa2BUA2]|uniref:Phosphoribosyltransferase n=1 Tax=Arthrobacter pullicola TaxID=2762224 RepID=A0ABR8YFR4_9MICC|nr:phosphoribosyltransferase family protein [Arthrobacter pullicola]MBD8042804.1 phosphoribosyltransferase [Arthrobacter pullicola]